MYQNTKFCVLSILIGLLLSSCTFPGSENGSTVEPTTTAVTEGIKGIVDYVAYEEIPTDYSVEDAKADGLVVIENGDMTSGQSVWEEFLENAQNNTPCMIRVMYHSVYGEDNSRVITAINDISFDGEKYCIYFRENNRKGAAQTKEFAYLKSEVCKAMSEQALYTESLEYYFVNDESLTWSDWQRSLYGTSQDPIDFRPLYSEYTYK